MCACVCVCEREREREVREAAWVEDLGGTRFQQAGSGDGHDEREANHSFGVAD